MTPTLQAILSFTLAAGLLTVTPGLDTALILRTATVKGSQQAFGVALGASVGCMLWCALVSLGLGALLLLSEVVYDLLRLMGACYLLYLGFQMLLKSRRNSAAMLVETATEPAMLSAKFHSWFYQGSFNNLLNPKVGAFYVTFLPQFMPAHANPATFGLLLGGIHAVEGMLWGLVLILATRPLAGWLKQPKITQRLDRLTGSVLLFFGAKLALEPRH